MSVAIKFICALVCSAAFSSRAQISVEIISRKDNLPILGAGSDTHILIHGIPRGAAVTINPGAVVHVQGDEYVLCRLGGYDPSVRGSVVLKVMHHDSVIFSKEYTLTGTRPSGSVYNPRLCAAFKVAASVADSSSQIMSLHEFRAALHRGLQLSDSSCHVYSADVCYMKGDTLHGPFPVGGLIYVCTSGDVLPQPGRPPARHWNFNASVLALLGRLDAPVSVFFDNIAASGPGGGIYYVRPKMIRIVP